MFQKKFMKHLYKLKAVIMVKSLLLICLSVSTIFSYSYTAIGSMAGDKTFVLNPYLYFDGSGAVGEDIYLVYGMTANTDIWSHISMVKTATGTTVDFSAMVRYDLGKNNIVVLRGSQWYVSPQYHFLWENNRFGFQANAAVQVAYDYYKEPAIYAVLSPIVKLFKGIDVFIEFNPGYYMHDGDYANSSVREKGFEFDLTGGIGFPIGRTSFSLSCPIYNVRTNPTPTFGMWWWCPITGK